MEIKEENIDEDKSVKEEVKEEQKNPIKMEVMEEIISSSDEEFDDVETVGFKF